jgi:hypothetical protein
MDKIIIMGVQVLLSPFFPFVICTLYSPAVSNVILCELEMRQRKGEKEKRLRSKSKAYKREKGRTSRNRDRCRMEGGEKRKICVSKTVVRYINSKQTATH